MQDVSETATKIARAVAREINGEETSIHDAARLAAVIAPLLDEFAAAINLRWQNAVGMPLEVAEENAEELRQ